MATAVKPSSPKALTEEDLSDIFQELIAIQAKWYNFGLVLKIPDHVLQSIEYRYPSSMDCLREVIKYFLKNHPDPTWETIVEALRSRTVGHANLARQLEDKKCCEEEYQPSVRELQQQFEQILIKLEEEVKRGSERDRRLKKLEVFSEQQEKSSREMKFAVDQRQRDVDERVKKEELKGRERDRRLKELEHVQSKQKSVELETETKEEHVGQQSKLTTSTARLGARPIAKKELPPIAFDEFFEKKQDIEQQIFQLLENYKRQQELVKQREEAKKVTEIILVDNDSKVTATLKRWERVETEQSNMICEAPGCYSNCHTPCNHTTTIISFVLFGRKSCSVINSADGRCTSCGHSHKDHHHSKFKYKEYSEEVEIINEEMQLKFLDAKDIEHKKRILITYLEKQIEESIEIRKEILMKLHQMIMDFKQLGIHSSYVRLLESKIALIEHIMKEGGAIDLEELKDKLESELKAKETAASGNSEEK